MTDDTLEAQARELVDTWTTDGEWIADREMAASIATWARRLVAESRAGALTHEAIALTEREARKLLASSPGAASPESLEPILGFQLGSTIDVPAHVAPAWLATAREVVDMLIKIGRCDTEIDVTRPYGDRYADRHSPTCRKCALLARPEVQRWAGR